MAEESPFRSIADKFGRLIAISVFGDEDGHPWSNRFRKGWDTQRNAVMGKASTEVARAIRLAVEASHDALCPKSNPCWQTNSFRRAHLKVLMPEVAAEMERLAEKERG
jgi:hypothetical protein